MVVLRLEEIEKKRRGEEILLDILHIKGEKEKGFLKKNSDEVEN